MTRKLTTTCDNCGQEIPDEEDSPAVDLYWWGSGEALDFCGRPCLWRYMNKLMLGEKDETQDIPFSDFVSTCTGGGEVCVHEGGCGSEGCQ